MENSVALSMTGVSAGYQQPVLHELNLTIFTGSLVGILGENGSGKTTLLKVMSGLLIPTHGEIEIFGRRLVTKQDRYWLRRRIGYLSQIQAPTGLPITVRDAVLLGRWGRFFYGWKRPTVIDYQRVDVMLDLVGMLAYRTKDWRELSGGQRQRVALARALVREPELLLMDEPTTYLDTKAQSSLISLIQQLQQELDITTIAVTHINHEDWRFSQMYNLSNGKLSRWSS